MIYRDCRVRILPSWPDNKVKLILEGLDNKGGWVTICKDSVDGTQLLTNTPTVFVLKDTLIGKEDE